MDTNRLSPEDALNLERHISILETPFSQVCRILGLESEELKDVIELDNSVFMFDSEQGHLFSGAVVLDSTYGFFGIEIGANWLQTAEKLESQGFVQAKNPERFTKPGQNFGTSVYLYPDSDSIEPKVQHYSLCIRYGSDP
ncbi:MAG: hypothetical protein FVQ85_18000 [Planctomycetes bacterium]|nr:hypothetical protein [Planctomycetota bacterium]